MLRIELFQYKHTDFVEITISFNQASMVLLY